MKNKKNSEIAFLGERLKYYRKKSNITQAQFSEKIGVSEHYVRLIENGYSVPSVALFIQICKTLEIPAYNLLQSKDEALRFSKPNFYNRLKSLDEAKLNQILNMLM
ncbi:hypothetical protein IMSAG013_00822 [Clostridiales bacterium]|nr:hypothetical protein IMSAG013_00822 [Clostridiales bacterium]